MSTRCDDGHVARFIESLRDFQPQAIIVADHGKGVVTYDLMAALGELNIPTFIDPVRQTPVPFRPTAIVGGPHELPPNADQAECLIEKHGPAGLTWSTVTANGKLPSACRTLVDPLGAGDQFIATLAYWHCREAGVTNAIERANFAAGVQCERAGCRPITNCEFASLHLNAQRLNGMVDGHILYSISSGMT